MTFGEHIRTVREKRQREDRAFSLRMVASRTGVQPAYLCKLEFEQTPPPSEQTIRRLAADLEENADVLLAIAGKVSRDLQEIVIRRPRLMADLLRELDEAPDDMLTRITREVRAGVS